jgi:Domain of unknown function (DUF4340)
MSAKHLKFIAIGLAALLLLWGGSELFSRGSDTVTAAFALPALAQADVDSVSVIKGADSIVLTKQASTGWTVNGQRAAPAGVADLFRALRDSERPEIVAQDSSSYARLQVDSVNARWLRLYRGGKPALTLVLGGRGSEYQSVYLRRPGDAHVYLWRGSLASLVDRRADDWRDKRIAALEPDSITALDVARGKDHYTLQRAGKTWTLNGSAPDSGAVARYLERLKSITASGFATPKEVDSTRSVRPARRLTVRGGRGVRLSLAFDSTASGYFVRGAGATVYRMNNWDVDGLTPTSQSLKPATPKPATSKPATKAKQPAKK